MESGKLESLEYCNQLMIEIHYLIDTLIGEI